ncbi:hypothetical protein MMC10_001204 [Thelotrema lepadinum]|nr:hypothetical protein [Thelotrema lepadinum]
MSFTKGTNGSSMPSQKMNFGSILNPFQDSIDKAMKVKRDQEKEKNEQERKTLELGVKEAARRRLEQTQREELSKEEKEDLKADVSKELWDRYKPKIKRQLQKELQRELQPQVMNELRNDLHDQVFEHLCKKYAEEAKEEAVIHWRNQLAGQVAEELRDELRQEVIDELREEVYHEVVKELKDEIRPALYKELRQELRKEILEELSSSDEVEFPEPAILENDGGAAVAKNGAVSAMGHGVAHVEEDGVADVDGNGVADVEGNGVADVEGNGVADVEGNGVADVPGNGVADSEGNDAIHPGLQNAEQYFEENATNGLAAPQYSDEEHPDNQLNEVQNGAEKTMTPKVKEETVSQQASPNAEANMSTIKEEQYANEEDLESIVQAPASALEGEKEVKLEEGFKINSNERPSTPMFHEETEQNAGKASPIEVKTEFTSSPYGQDPTEAYAVEEPTVNVNGQKRRFSESFYEELEGNDARNKRARSEGAVPAAPNLYVDSLPPFGTLAKYADLGNMQATQHPVGTLPPLFSLEGLGTGPVGTTFVEEVIEEHDSYFDLPSDEDIHGTDSGAVANEYGSEEEMVEDEGDYEEDEDEMAYDEEDDEEDDEEGTLYLTAQGYVTDAPDTRVGCSQDEPIEIDD